MLKGKLLKLFIGGFIVSQAIILPFIAKDIKTTVNTQSSNNNASNYTYVKTLENRNNKNLVKIKEVINNPIGDFYVEHGEVAYILEDNSYIIKKNNGEYEFYSIGDDEYYCYNTYEEMIEDIKFIPYFEVI